MDYSYQITNLSNKLDDIKSRQTRTNELLKAMVDLLKERVVAVVAEPGTSPATETAGSDPMGAESRITEDGPCHVVDATIPETPPSSPSVQPTTPTFRVMPRCACVSPDGWPVVLMVKKAPLVVEVGCWECRVSWATVEIHVPDVAPAIST